MPVKDDTKLQSSMLYHVIVYVSSVHFCDEECYVERDVFSRPKVWLLTEHLVAVKGIAIQD